MKTIKELLDKEVLDLLELVYGCALKDVLKLIDELMNPKFNGWISAKELKARIEG